jgi:hypothetical protein
MYRGWTEGARPETQPKPIKGQLALDVGPDMMDTLTKVVTGFTMLGLLYGLTHWARPTLRASKMQEKNGVWGWLQSVIDSIQTFLDHGTNYVGHKVSQGAAHAAAGPTKTLDTLALRWEQMVWQIADFAHEMQLVTGRLVHHVIPHQINRQTVPIRARLRRLERGLAVETRDLNALRHWIHAQLNRHVYPRLGRLETRVNHTLPQRIRRGERLQNQTRARQQAQQRSINKLLPLLTIAGATALVLRALPRLGLNYLRCQNMKDFGNELCPSSPGTGGKAARFLRGLFSGLGGLLAPLFICQLFQAAVVVVGPLMSKMIETVGFVGNALCDGEHQAAPPLVLHVTADPPVPNPIAL